MPSSFDQEFIDMMVPHHQAGIEMSRLAEQRAEHASLKELASDMIAAQAAEIRQMEQWGAGADGDAAAPKPGKDGMAGTRMGHSGASGKMDMKKADIQEVMRDLRSADPFDKAFLRAMIPHHQMAIDMAEPVSKRAGMPELKKLADRIAAAQSKEVTQMKRWLRDWK